MNSDAWAGLFDHAEPQPGLPVEWQEAVSASVQAPLDSEERAALQAEEAPDLEAWQFPIRELPSSYLQFLSWSNGGFFLTGNQEWNILAAEQLREYMLVYRFPYFQPGRVPIALDGQGGFFALDLSSESEANGEFPVVFFPEGDLTATPETVARSFLELFTRHENPGQNSQTVNPG